MAPEATKRTHVKGRCPWVVALSERGGQSADPTSKHAVVMQTFRLPGSLSSCEIGAFVETPGGPIRIYRIVALEPTMNARLTLAKDASNSLEHQIQECSRLS